MKKTTLTFITLLITGFTSLLKAQLTTNNALTPQQLVQQVLLGGGVVASNITFTGDAAQIAKFNATTSTSLGLASGIVISTGKADSNDPEGPQGPNNTAGASTDFTNNGDADLDNIINPDQTNDAAILEFDFVPQGDSIKFRYVFGSEEYNEYVNSSFNDVFAYMLSGPNPAGGNYVKQNIALVPGTSVPISIGNVNNGYKANAGGNPAQATGPCQNCAFYRDNYNSNVDIQYDGVTAVLTAKAAVNCGQQYHIKIAIGDVFDGAFDSGVFLEAGSFSSAPPITLGSTNANSLINDTLLYEDCNTYCIKFIRTGNIALADSFNLSVGGNAINGVDYAALTGTVTSNYVWPSKIVFQANQDTFKFCGLKVIDDSNIEGLDTLRFNIVKFTPSTSSCVSSNSLTLRVYFSDYKAINIGANDSIICNSSPVALNASATMGTPAYSYTWQPGNINTTNYTTPIITQTSVFTITVNDICNKPVTKQVTISPTTLPELSNIDSKKFCLDSIVKVTASVNGGAPPFQYNWYAPLGGLIPYDTISNSYYVKQSQTPSAGSYMIVIQDQCNQKDTMEFGLETVDCTILVPNVITGNGDNVNDVFKIQGLDNFDNSTLAVFNRWGKRVYSSTNYKNDWKPDTQDGTYFYVLEVSDGRTFSGFFQLYQ